MVFEAIKTYDWNPFDEKSGDSIFDNLFGSGKFVHNMASKFRQDLSLVRVELL